MIRTSFRALAAATALLVSSAAPAAPAYVATSYAGNSIVFLDGGLQPVSSFAVEDFAPNAVGASGSLIFAAYFTSSSVVAYGYDGVEHFRWWRPELYRVQGLALIGPWMAAASDDMLYLFEAKTGDKLAQLDLGEDTVEGLTYDGRYLWSIGSTLTARDVDTGAIVKTLPNAAFSSCPFGGTGISAGPQGSLMLGCADGEWFRVSTDDGHVMAAGNNGVDMFDLAALPVPEPATFVLTALGLAGVGAAARRRRR